MTRESQKHDCSHLIQFAGTLDSSVLNWCWGFPLPKDGRGQSQTSSVSQQREQERMCDITACQVGESCRTSVRVKQKVK